MKGTEARQEAEEGEGEVEGGEAKGTTRGAKQSPQTPAPVFENKSDANSKLRWCSQRTHSASLRSHAPCYRS